MGLLIATEERPGLAAEGPQPMRLRARALAGLFAMGATLAFATVALPHPASADEAGTLAIAAAAMAVAIVLYLRASAVQPWMLQVALAIGTAMITGVAYLSATSPSPLIFFYLWIFLYSAYFFDDSTTLLQIGFAAIASAGLLLARPPSGGVVAWWLVTTGTLLTSAVLIRTMRRRVESLIDRLHETARTDQLTGLPNRQGFREVLDRELERARRGETRLAVLVGDLDSFKELNDRSGNQVGDAVLVRVARMLEANRRPSDTLARVGGGEFSLILPDTDEGEALIVGERLRSLLAREFAAEVNPVTISFGISAYPRQGTAGSLLRAGDEAVHAAKLLGRNRTMIHTPELLRTFEQGNGSRDVVGERFTAAMLDLAEAVDLRFSGSARHSETVGRYCEMIAIELGLPRERVKRVRLAGILHDIGKVMVPEPILKKPGRLTEAELETIRLHPGYGAQILDHPALADVRSWVAAHHERPDGKGYPLGIDDSTLALEPRILAVADSYEAMTSDRSYQSSIGHEAARAELQRCAGSQFDPRVVSAFLAILRRESERATESLAGG